MTSKYIILNPFTGQHEEAATYDEALVLQTRLKKEYMDYCESLFVITVMVENENGTWTQGISDDFGELINYTTRRNAWNL